MTLKRISEEEKRKKLRERRLANRASLTLAYQLGFYVGEQIIDKYLPTISVDSIQTRQNISVTAAEGDECRRLHSVWLEKARSSDNSESEWNALRSYHKYLEDKYLPQVVECNFHLLNVTEENMEEFKKGVGVALWESDCSHYSTNPPDIDVKADDSGLFTVITIKKG